MMRRRFPRKRCPIPGCEAEIISHYLMCTPHWRTLPKGMRDRHQIAFRAWKATLLSSARDRDEMRVNTAALRDSCERTVAEATRLASVEATRG